MVDLRVKTDPFSSRAKAWSEYERLGYFPARVDVRTDKLAKVGTDSEQIALRIRANGLAVVTFPAGVHDRSNATEWFVPVFTDSDGKNARFLFRGGIGDVDAALGECHLRSWNTFPDGWAVSLERFVEVPYPGQNDLVWLRPPSHRTRLVGLPAPVLTELARVESAI